MGHLELWQFARAENLQVNSLIHLNCVRWIIHQPLYINKRHSSCLKCILSLFALLCLLLHHTFQQWMRQRTHRHSLINHTPDSFPEHSLPCALDEVLWKVTTHNHLYFKNMGEILASLKSMATPHILMHMYKIIYNIWESGHDLEILPLAGIGGSGSKN